MTHLECYSIGEIHSALHSIALMVQHLLLSGVERDGLNVTKPLECDGESLLWYSGGWQTDEYCTHLQTESWNIKETDIVVNTH